MIDHESLCLWLTELRPSLNLDRLAPRLLRQFLHILGMDHGYMVLREPHGDQFNLAAAIGIAEAVGIPPLSAAEVMPFAQVEMPTWVHELPEDLAVRPALIRLEGLVQSGSQSDVQPLTHLLIPLHNQERFDGLIGLGARQQQDISFLDSTDLELVSALGMHGACLVDAALVHERLGVALRDFLKVCAEGIDSKEEASHGHSKAVAYYAVLIAQQLGLSETETEAIEIAAFLHDIGRVSIPDEILRKQSALTPDEFEVVKTYPARGAELVSQVSGFEAVAPIVRHHCERWDGGGYPDGLRGEDIPFGARILGVAHRFTSMISRRSYRRPLSVVTGAMDQLNGEAGQALDPRVVRALFAGMGKDMSPPASKISKFQRNAAQGS